MASARIAKVIVEAESSFNLFQLWELLGYLIQKSIFREIGFAEQVLKTAYNMISDFCL